MSRLKRFTSPRDKIASAKGKLIFNHPFYGNIILNLRLIPDPSHPSAWTDGQVIGYNPDYVMDLSLDTLIGVLAHEAMHTAHAHHARKKDRDHMLWNIACDYAINEFILASDMSLPEGVLTGMGMEKSAETIYREVKEQASKQENAQAGAQEGQGGEGASGESDAGQNGSSGSSGNTKGKGKHPTDSMSEQQKQEEGWEPTPEEKAELNRRKGPKPGRDFGGTGEVKQLRNPDGSAMSEGQAKAAQAEARELLAKAANAAKMQGKLPAGIARMVESLLEPKVDWKQLLHTFLDRMARNDYNWLRPSRRHLNRGIIMPSLHSLEMPDIVVAVDTSGSVSDEDLEEIAAEISGILEETQATIHVVYVDAQYSGHETFEPDDLPLKLNASGGGGTSFVPAFEFVEREIDDLACLIYLTDGYCNDFPDMPDYPVFWGIINGSEEFHPPFGENVIIRKEDRA
jgi:predicted metal-dependent peptidase